MSFGDRVVAQIRGDHPRLPPAEPNPLQKAYDDYNDMKREYAQAKHEANELRVHNQALMAEVGMLRESMERCDSDRIRLQAVSSTLLGRLLAINAVIGDAVKDSVKHGIQAVEAAAPETQRQDAEEARGILERVEPATELEPVVTLAPNRL